MAMREEDNTVRTQLAELRVETRAVRERMQARDADSLRRLDMHSAEDARRFDKLDEAVEEIRGEFKLVRDAIAALTTSGAVASARGSWMVAGLVGALSFAGTVAVAVLEHLWR